MKKKSYIIPTPISPCPLSPIWYDLYACLTTFEKQPSDKLRREVEPNSNLSIRRLCAALPEFENARLHGF